jgi:hypothetical protein
VGEKGFDRGGVVTVLVPHEERVPLGDGGPDADDPQGMARRGRFGDGSGHDGDAQPAVDEVAEQIDVAGFEGDPR